MNRKKLDESVLAERESSLRVHLERCGFHSSDAYQSWCVQFGLSKLLHKDARRRENEVRLRASQAADRRLAQARHDRKQEMSILPHARKPGNRPSVELGARPNVANSSVLLRSTAPARYSPYTQLMAHVRRVRAKFFDLTPAWPSLGVVKGNTFGEALRLIAYQSARWHRPIEDWKPRSHNALRQFQSLVRHLFDQYGAVPKFFDQVWFKGTGADARLHRDWYLHVAKGQNLRTCKTPIPVTKKLAHYFLQAPIEATIEQALRWGQVHAMGGDERLARALFGTRLGESFENDEFWTTVIAWLIQNPMLDTAHVGPLVDYLHNQRFGRDRIVFINGEQQLAEPLQPNLTMKGRSPETLLRQVEEWHRSLTRSNRSQLREWKPCGIVGLQLVEGQQQNERQWVIRELLSSHSLFTEGRQMQHCVATYAHSCQAGHCSIWTMELENRAEVTKLVTIEVRNATRVICQARGKANRSITERERAILQRWADAARLTLAKYV